MPSTSRLAAPVVLSEAEIEGRAVEFGPYTVEFQDYLADTDPAPLFAGLPDGRCQCPHWGVVLSGQVTYRWADHSETYRAGDAYYAPPGHLPLVFDGSSIVEFSPTADLAKTSAVLGAALAARQGALS